MVPARPSRRLVLVDAVRFDLDQTNTFRIYTDDTPESWFAQLRGRTSGGATPVVTPDADLPLEQVEMLLDACINSTPILGAHVEAHLDFLLECGQRLMTAIYTARSARDVMITDLEATRQRLSGYIAQSREDPTT